MVEKYWDNVPGKLSYISVGRDGAVWGTNSLKEVYRRTGVTKALVAGSDWEKIDGVGYSITVCTTGMIIHVGSDYNLYYRTGQTDEEFVGKSWAGLDGGDKFKWVGCGKNGWFVAIKEDGYAYGRMGVTTLVPQGTGWYKLPFPAKMDSVSIGEDGDVWGAYPNKERKVVRTTTFNDKEFIYGKSFEYI